jgi:ABC-type antimicrobial peptide transport system permease subunit
MNLANVDNSSYLEWDGMQESDKFLITHANVDPDFIPALNMKMLAGKNFNRQITNDTASYILNESSVRRMGYDNQGILGKEVIFWGKKGKVIGVVKDFHFKPLSAVIEPFIFRYQPQDRYFRMFLKLQEGRIEEALKVVQKIYSKYEEVYPLELSFVNERVNEAYKKDKYVANIILVFSILTIFIGCLGLFGLTVFSVEQRVREIGIRKVLGAGVASIMQLLLTDFLRLVLIGTVVAVPFSWYSSFRWLENYAYRIEMEWWVFAIAILGVMLIAVATIGIQARRSALVSPVKSLRTE